MKANNQRIGCQVTSCRFNRNNVSCGLDEIQVLPCQNCGTGQAAGESMCGSYEVK